MARKKIEKEIEEMEDSELDERPSRSSKRQKKQRGVFRDLQDETRQHVWGIVFFVIGIFLILAAFGGSTNNLAGRAGGFFYGAFHSLLGIGYYMIPLLAFMLGISFMRAMERSFALTKTIGAVIFFLSSLGTIGTIGIIANDRVGGILGYFVALPLVTLFDIYATLIFLLALVGISCLIIFDTHINFHTLRFIKRLFSKKEKIPSAELDTEEEKKADAAIAVEMKKVEEKPEPEVKKKAPLGKLDEKDFSVSQRHFTLGAKFVPPPLSLLERDKGKPEVGDIKAQANIIKRTLQNFGITVEMDEISIGPTVTRYALKPAEGVKLSKIVALQNDLSLALAAHPIRIEAPIPGKSLVGIEIPNVTKTMVGLGSMFAMPEFLESPKPMLVSVGRGISGTSHFSDLAKMPHLLVAGATGSGKSVTIHTLITSLLYRNSPEDMKFIMIDPKRVELTLYNKIPHLLTPVITDAKKTILSLKWAAKEMDRRYDVLQLEKCRDINSYHKNILGPAMKKYEEKMAKGTVDENDQKKMPETMPYIVIVIDELADLMQAYPRELESAIVRLAQMSRAVGIHLIISTQRPSVNVITGLIKANIPTRIALQVASQIDSRTILDMGGAEELLGAGDMLYLSPDISKPIRVQCPFISESEVKKVVDHVAEQYEGAIPSEINFSEEQQKNALFDAQLDAVADMEDEDELYEEAREIVIESRKASTSFLQRKLGVGYARAAKLIDSLEARGVVGPANGSKARDVLEGAPQGIGEDFAAASAEAAREDAKFGNIGSGEAGGEDEEHGNNY